MRPLVETASGTGRLPLSRVAALLYIQTLLVFCFHRKGLMNFLNRKLKRVSIQLMAYIKIMFGTQNSSFNCFSLLIFRVEKRWNTNFK